MFPPVGANAHGQDFFNDVLLGRVPNFSMTALTGVNEAVGAVSADVSDQNTIVVPLLAADSFEVISDDADDIAVTGTGVRAVLITFLDASWEEVVVIVAMNGLAAVAVPGTFLRARSVVGIDSGTSGWNEGTVDVRLVTGAVVHLQMSPFNNSSFSGMFSVPAGKTARVITVSVFIAKNDEIQFQPYLIQPNQNFISGQPIRIFDGNAHQRLLNPFPITEKQDFVFRATKISAAAAHVSIIAEILLESVLTTP